MNPIKTNYQLVIMPATACTWLCNGFATALSLLGLDVLVERFTRVIA